MDTPFPYDKYVTGKNFIGRKGSCTLLGNLISQGEHVWISAPPKTGKTSLIQQTLFGMRMSGKSFSVGQFSVLNIRTPQEFLLRMGSTAIRMVASTPEEYARVALQYLEGTHFVFDRVAFSERDEVLSANWDLDENDVLALLRLPFRLAADKGQQLILILDEFQNVSLFDDPDLILRPLQTVLREEAAAPARHFVFLFTGSRVNAMNAIFQQGILFRRLVERVTLETVDEREIADHVVKGFLSGGKVIDKDLLVGACKLFQNHLWYINHFAAICDSMSKGYIMEPVLVDALGTLLAIHEPRFQAIVDGLTTFQVNLLQAVVEGEYRFSAADSIRRYGLNSSANVKRVKDALMKKEVLIFDEKEHPAFIDPLFEYWIRKYYFEIKDA